FQAEDGIRDDLVTGVQTCALPIFEIPRVDEHVEQISGEREDGGEDVDGAREEHERERREREAELERTGRRDTTGGDRAVPRPLRSEERRVGKEWRAWGGRGREQKR